MNDPENLVTRIVTRDDGKCFAYINFGRNSDIPRALEIFVQDILNAGYMEQRHTFEIEAINDKGFLDPGSIRVWWGNAA